MYFDIYAIKTILHERPLFNAFCIHFWHNCLTQALTRGHSAFIYIMGDHPKEVLLYVLLLLDVHYL